MPTTKVMNGRLMRISLDGEKTVYATSSSIQITVEFRETSNKDVTGGWRDGESGIKSWTFSAEGQYSEDSTVNTEARANAAAFFDLADTGDNVAIVFETGVIGDTVYTGSAVITSLEYSFPNNENATYSISGEGAGALVKSTAA